MISEFSVIDAVYQVMAFLSIFGVFALVFFVIKNSLANNRRTRRLEEKIDALNTKLDDAKNKT